MFTYPNICDLEDTVKETGDVERAINVLSDMDYEIYKMEMRLAILKQDQKSVSELVYKTQLESAGKDLRFSPNSKISPDQ